MKRLYYWLVRNGLGAPVGIMIGLICVLMWSICAHTQTPKPTPPPQWMAPQQVDVETHTFQEAGKTVTVKIPLIGCLDGYILWSGHLVPVYKQIGSAPVFEMEWHEALEQRHKYRHPKYQLICGLKGLTPPEAK
jgi:hypothetical protein